METWDLYDKDRNKLNKTIDAQTKLLEDQYRLLVHVCFFNQNNQMLIQKRNINKLLYPKLWDFSVGGSVQANEDSRQAAEREIKEELGISISLKDIRPSLTFNFNEGFDDFYLVKLELDITQMTLQETEVEGVKWASQNEIGRMIKFKEFIPYHPSVLDLVFHMKNDMKIHTD